MFIQPMRSKVASFGVVALLILGSVLFTLSGCTSSSDSAESASVSAQVEESSQAAPQVNVQIIVEAPSIPDFEPFNSSVTVLTGTTVLDAMQATTLDLVIEESEYGAFISSINGLANEGTSGWTYTVDGAQPSVSAGAQEVSPGNEIRWTYIDMAEGGLDDDLTQDAEQ